MERIRIEDIPNDIMFNRETKLWHQLWRMLDYHDTDVKRDRLSKLVPFKWKFCSDSYNSAIRNRFYFWDTKGNACVFSTSEATALINQDIADSAEKEKKRLLKKHG